MNKKASLIPWWNPNIGTFENKFLQKVLKDNFPNEGPMTVAFEDSISKLLKCKYTIAVPNATSAMFLSLKALGIGAGDEVIVPDVSFIATANAVEMTGAKVVLVDVNKVNLTLDLDSFKNAITSKTRAVIPVHVSGRAANISSICKTAERKNIFVVEDAAEAFMSKSNGKYLGTFGDTGCFSFSPAKIITTGQGGIIVTNNKNLYLSLKKLKDQGRPKRGTGGDDIHESIGYNFKFTDLQAAVGLGQLKYLKKRMQRLQKNNMLYREYLKNIPEISIFDVNITKGELPLWTDAVVAKRDELDKYLQKNNIDCRRFWLPIHQQKPYKLSDSIFPISSKLSKESFWLPSAFTLTDADIKKVCNHIRNFFNHTPLH